MKMKKVGSFFWGVILGTMAGFVVGILLAPKKEKESKIRNILGKKTEELIENLQNISKKIGNQVDQIKSNFEKKWSKNKIDKMDKVEDELGT
ncbi:YtxH domain-containing protein [Blattabacterium cuenoti]|uniref:YtxH domain-containing protein n=1 Tax=Blattabacterium cuenoti TaxID=1653831 RepID=UPI001EEC0A27|nr:YtxH domain-containing protein [Blattabacterium cuenoti]